MGNPYGIPDEVWLAARSGSWGPVRVWLREYNDRHVEQVVLVMSEHGLGAMELPRAPVFWYGEEQ